MSGEVSRIAKRMKSAEPSCEADRWVIDGLKADLQTMIEYYADASAGERFNATPVESRTEKTKNFGTWVSFWGGIEKDKKRRLLYDECMKLGIDPIPDDRWKSGYSIRMRQHE